MTRSSQETTVIEFGFLLIPQFSMLSFSSVLEPLRMANRLAGRTLYNWHLLSTDGKPVPASNGIALAPTLAMSDARQLQTLIVVAGLSARQQCSATTLRWLKGLAAQGVNMGSTSVGSLFLAKAGLLNGYRCTIHWENLDSFREEFPRAVVTNELYEIDGKRMTCSGGTAGMDMMMHLIARQHGHALAAAVAEQSIHPEIRKSHASQRLSLRTRFNVSNPNLIAAIACMERHLEDTLNNAQIAQLVGVSVRHLDRLFQSKLQTTSARFYLGLRLDKSRLLLQQTSMSMSEIADASGFATVSHFTRCFKARFGLTPAAERRQEERRATNHDALAPT